ncbi:Periodic tryptophan protein 1-like protein [Hypsibius exemplaris]|uniref:Periodic tryptophan protein 1-like protein n=1 Tax=Hypsibius exemplaris TaxID=2072580 RepID=A0A1W0WE51_HYPEX|nr:Periodic tryptophan protein 1-like protein [Hypsibius exemplaris]
MNFISSIAWVPRGKAKAVPETVRLKPDELKELFEGARSAEDSEDAANSSETEDKEDEEAASEEEEWSDADDEPESEVDQEDVADEVEEPAVEGAASGFSVSSLALFPTNDDDPYVQIKDADDVDSEDEDFKIQPGDNLLAVAHVDEDASILEVYVYNEKDDDLYVHHDLMLPAEPLALEWLSYLPGGDAPGNLVAVATMKPTIQIWDLDLVNAMEPLFELKGVSKKRQRGADPNSFSGHTDAVLSLAWNPLVDHVLASGSADQSVILWDLDQAKAATTLKGFSDKVQTIKWRPEFADQLLCGSCDKTVRLFDCRYKKAKATAWNVEGEVERLLWSTADNQYFYVATEDGQLYTFDIRNPEAALSTIQAHGKSVTGLVASPHIPGLLVTTSEDKRIKVWDVQGSHIPDLVLERKLKMGEIQFAAMSPDSPFVISLGGEDSDSNFRILNLYHISEEVKKRFDARIPEEYRKKIPVTKDVLKAEKLQRRLPPPPTSAATLGNSAKTYPPNGQLGKRGKIKHAKRRGLLAGQVEVKPSQEPPTAAAPSVVARAPRLRPKNEHGKRQGWSGQDSRRTDGGAADERKPTAAGKKKEEHHAASGNGARTKQKFKKGKTATN